MKWKETTPILESQYCFKQNSAYERSWQEPLQVTCSSAFILGERVERIIEDRSLFIAQGRVGALLPNAPIRFLNIFMTHPPTPPPLPSWKLVVCQFPPVHPLHFLSDDWFPLRFPWNHVILPKSSTWKIMARATSSHVFISIHTRWKSGANHRGPVIIYRSGEGWGVVT